MLCNAFVDRRKAAARGLQSSEVTQTSSVRLQDFKAVCGVLLEDSPKPRRSALLFRVPVPAFKAHMTHGSDQLLY